MCACVSTPIQQLSTQSKVGVLGNDYNDTERAVIVSFSQSRASQASVVSDVFEDGSCQLLNCYRKIPVIK